MAGDKRLQTQDHGIEDFSSGGPGGVERPNIEDIEGIYRQHSKRVYSLCLRMTGDSTEAQDLTQEAFLLLYRKLDTFRGESSFYTWFHRLCVNVVRAKLRRKRRLMEMSLDEMMESGCRDGAPHGEIPAPRAKLHARIDQLSLRQVVERLPRGFRHVLVLHDVEGFEHREISEMLDCSVGTSKSQLHRARTRMRKLLVEGSYLRGPKENSRVGNC